MPPGARARARRAGGGGPGGSASSRCRAGRGGARRPRDARGPRSTRARGPRAARCGRAASAPSTCDRLSERISIASGLGLPGPPAASASSRASSASESASRCRPAARARSIARLRATVIRYENGLARPGSYRSPCSQSCAKASRHASSASRGSPTIRRQSASTARPWRSWNASSAETSPALMPSIRRRSSRVPVAIFPSAAMPPIALRNATCGLQHIADGGATRATSIGSASGGFPDRSYDRRSRSDGRSGLAGTFSRASGNPDAGPLRRGR